MKSLSSFNHLATFDLSKVGTAYQIINSFVDDQVIHVFEISPMGSRAVLILVSQDLISLQVVYNQVLSMHKADILISTCIEMISPKILETYLSQNRTQMAASLLIVETDSFSMAFDFGQKLALKNIELVDFRVVRTGPPNIIITATGSSEALNIFLTASSCVKTTLIDQVQKPLKAYFEILVN